MAELHLNSQLYDFDRDYLISADSTDCRIIGIDEAGRGCLAGDVFAAAVVLSQNKPISGLDDSKKLSPAKRELLYDEIIEKSIVYAIATASVDEIEEINILNAALLAMKRAYEQIADSVTTEIILIDGNKAPALIVNCQLSTVNCIVGGDGKSAAIAAASILAKVARDRYMLELDKAYPEFGFAKHKGYATKLHREAVLKYGASPVHRESFLKKLRST